MSDETKGKHMRGFADEQSAEFKGKNPGAAKQADGNKAVLRARPVKGEVDHNALSKEFIARFPKLRAALAK